MCPLRFILVFFSAVLAGYLTWKSVSPSDEPNKITIPAAAQDSTHENKNSTAQKQEFNSLKMIQNRFWVLIDMASGRYLWRNFKQLNSNRES